MHNRRTWVSLILALGLLLPMMADGASAQDWAEKMFKVTEHDFRIVGRGTKSEFHFELTNLYEEDVHIQSVRTSCGCTTPSVTKQTLKTYETGAVVAAFNTNTFIGQKSATITVVFDKPTYSEVQLKVSGFIRTDITFDPPEINYGELSAGQTREQEVVITHSGNSNWEITDVRSHCNNLQVRLDSAERSQGMVRYRMRVRIDGKMPEGEIRERLTLISNDRDFPTTEMAISGRVRPVVSVAPASVSLGTTRRDGKVERRLVVRGDEPFEIMDVQCADRRFEFEVPVGKKKVQFVKLRFTGDGTTDSISQQVRIITDLPGQKSTSCIVTGTVQ
ncbi:MAG: DUF1573 domain-containing protein [Planctomycetota bacterium]